MEFTVFERLLILNLDTLPTTGNIVTMKVKKKLIDDTGFSEEELKLCNFVEKDGNLAWSAEAENKEVEIGPEAIKLLIQAIEKSQNVSEAMVPLYDRLREVK